MALDSNEKPAVKPGTPGAYSTHTNVPSTEKEVNMGSNDDIDIVDLEEFAVAGKPAPPGKRYRIRIDKEIKVAEVDHLTGRQILALVHKSPDKFLLRQRIQGGVKPVEPDQKVSFLEPGIERFMTIPHEVREGDGAAPRRAFALLKGDEAFLNSLGSRWEAVVDGGVNAVIIYGWPLPQGYNVARADVHVRFSSGYPDTQLDMAYFLPMLARADGRGIGGLSEAGLDGRKWQQWSRHRTEASTWRSDIDDLSTHMALVDDWLAAEFRK